MYCESF
ncbi:hypothetical protein Zm00014a_038436 [Zea mays]|nr:hypothetical protein Zm00014a_038436 [Zea mays]